MLFGFTKKELLAAIKNQRSDIIQLVGGLSESQLKHESLCVGWNVDNALGHILGFELSRLDLFKLLLRIKELDDITADQARRYEGLNAELYAELLQKGVKRINRLVRFTPEFLLNVKWIPVPNGLLSLGQIYGDLVLDRAVHRLDISHPLNMGSEIKDKSVLKVCLKFVIECLDLVEGKIPPEYHGKVIRLLITGKVGGGYDWVVGERIREFDISNAEPALTINVDINDFLFVVTVRPELVKHDVEISGDEKLANIIRGTLNANALWET